MKAKYIIGSIIIVVFVIWGASAFLKTTIKYVTFAEAREATRTVQVAGRIDFNDVHFDAEKNRLEFSIIELKNDSEKIPERMKVVYGGIVPGNFDQATSVLVIGKPGNGVFEAEKLLVKCPSKYQGLAEQSQG
nr:cytochrome c maturation protein CcmE [candidate division Zixibacteria bacterium]